MNDRPTASKILQLLGLDPDPWQVQVLEGNHSRLLLNCSRQAGKSTAVAMLSLYQALYEPGALILLLSPSLRQSAELFSRVADFYRRIRSPLLERRTKYELCLQTTSRIVSLPCEPDNIRGYSNVHMLVIDEASRVPDKLYRTVRPMLAVSHGRLICLSTPHGKRGFFYEAWANGGNDWTRIEVPARQVPRIRPEFLEEERRTHGSRYFRQEYECSFESLEGLVYPDFAKCIVTPAQRSVLASDGCHAHASRGHAPSADVATPLPPCGGGSGWRGTSAVPFLPTGKPVGGIDFGYRNPFAAVWGVLDRDGILWLVGEHYQSEKPLSYHARFLPKNVYWHADPSGAQLIRELRCAGFIMRNTSNHVESGIAAVSARLENGTLRVLEGRCPNLLAEAALYRYSTDASERKSETPAASADHALDALRYLIASIDANKMARIPQPRPVADGTPATDQSPAPPPRKPRPWLRLDNEALWTRLY
jgi:hypothetical protein